MALASLILFTVIASDPLTPPPLPIPGLVTELPAPEQLQISSKEEWTIQQVGVDKDDTDYTPGKTVVVPTPRGRVTLKPTNPYEYIIVSEVGRDGSVVFVRRGDNVTSGGIYYRGKVLDVEGGIVDVYRDRLNYAYSDPLSELFTDMPATANVAHVLENGKKRDLGWGRVQHWGPDGLFILSVTVDDSLQPAGMETRTRRVTRLVWRGGNQAIADYSFVSREKDGTVVLVSNPDGGSTTDYSYLDDPTRELNHILRWKNGRFISHWRLPKPWYFAGRSKAGWFLLRHAPPLRQNLWSHQYGKTVEEADRIEKKYHAEHPSLDEDWGMAILRNGRIASISFHRPKGSESFTWYDRAVLGKEALRFEALGNRSMHAYRLSPKRRR